MGSGSQIFLIFCGQLQSHSSDVLLHDSLGDLLALLEISQSLLGFSLSGLPFLEHGPVLVRSLVKSGSLEEKHHVVDWAVAGGMSRLDTKLALVSGHLADVREQVLADKQRDIWSHLAQNLVLLVSDPAEMYGDSVVNAVVVGPLDMGGHVHEVVTGLIWIHGFVGD